MDNIFNPNEAAYQSQMLTAAQKRKMADALRERADSFKQPTGQMIGTGRTAQFVAPSLLEALGPAFQQGIAGYYGGKADVAAQAAQAAKLAEEQRAIDAQMQDAEQWRAGMPQAVAAQAQQTAPYMAPGMDGPENIPGTETITQQAQEAQPVTTDQILKHTLAGMRNPMIRDEAGIYNKAALGEVDREDRQRQALQLAHEAAAARQKAEQERRQWQEEQNALYKRTADQQTRMLQATLAAKGGGGGGGGFGGAAPVVGADEAGNPIYRHTKSGKLFVYGDMGQPVAYEGAVGAKPGSGKSTEGEKSAAGYLGRMEAVEGKIKDAPALTLFQQLAANKTPTLAPYAMNNQQQATRAMQEDWVRAKLRKESGAAIPADEMEREIRTYFPMPGEGADAVLVKAQARAQAREQLRTMAGSVKPTIADPVSPPAGAGGAPVRVTSRADVDKLPPGTRFVTPDGRVMEK